MIREIDKLKKKCKKYLEEMNKIWTMVGKKVYESVDFLDIFYNRRWNGMIHLDNLSANTHERIKRIALFQEKNKGKKLLI